MHKRQVNSGEETQKPALIRESRGESKWQRFQIHDTSWRLHGAGTGLKEADPNRKAAAPSLRSYSAEERADDQRQEDLRKGFWVG